MDNAFTLYGRIMQAAEMAEADAGKVTIPAETLQLWATLAYVTQDNLDTTRRQLEGERTTARKNYQTWQRDKMELDSYVFASEQGRKTDEWLRDLLTGLGVDGAETIAEGKKPYFTGRGQITALCDRAYTTALHNGFHEGDSEGDVNAFCRMISLIHCELSEAVEAVRNKEGVLFVGKDGKPEGMPAELADVVIRCFDLAGFYGIDLEYVLLRKMAYNETRPYKHGKEF